MPMKCGGIGDIETHNSRKAPVEFFYTILVKTDSCLNSIIASVARSIVLKDKTLLQTVPGTNGF